MNQRAELKSKFPIEFSEEQLQEVIPKARDYAIMKAAAMRSKQNFSVDSLNFAPFVLLPSPFPKPQFERSCNLQPILNELMYKIAADSSFLRSALEETIKVDSFTKRLFDIFEIVQKEGIAQPISLGLLRSDVMLEGKECIPGECDGKCYCCCRKQVEINTIASGFGHLGPVSRVVQQFVLQELGFLNEETVKNLPENKALSGLCDGMVEAWKMYNQPKAVILFVIEEVPYNICDQRQHEFYLRETYPHIRVIRRTLTEIAAQATLGENKKLFIKNEEVAFVYFRSGYEPGQYPSDKEWAARLLVERSFAIKSPTIAYHLAGTKKVQQILAAPGVLNRFITDENKIAEVKEIFTGLYGLDDDEEGNKAVEMAMKDPQKFVMKPQREGGMNNIYGEDIPKALENMTIAERKAWILMDRINPPISKGYIVRPGGPDVPPLIEMVSELGIFGVILADGEKIHSNYQAGHMLRTKVSTANEGGVATGAGALDSPYLICECC